MVKENLAKHIKSFAFNIAMGSVLSASIFWSVIFALIGDHSWWWVILNGIVITGDFIEAKNDWNKIKLELEKIKEV